MEGKIMPDIELKKIKPNRLNPRLEFTKAGLDELADSIKQVGLLEPIIVRPYEGEYQVVVGERRYRAAQQAGLDVVPAIIRNYTDDEVMELNLIENIQREDLSAVEKGRVCKQLRERFPEKYPTWEAIAHRCAVDFQTVRRWIETLGLPEEIQRKVAPREVQRQPAGKIDYATAIEIGRKVKEPERQVELARELAERHVPQRTAKQIIKGAAREPEKSVEQVFREVVEEAPVFLPFSKVHADAILKEIKTQTSRKAKDPRLQRGITVRAQVTHFADLEVTDVYRKKLGDFDEEDARREGGYTLDEFKEVWKRLHGEWNPNESVYVIRFRVARVVGEPDSSG
jgi:ParB family chromosome partitioning protein